MGLSAWLGVVAGGSTGNGPRIKKVRRSDPSPQLFMVDFNLINSLAKLSPEGDKRMNPWRLLIEVQQLPSIAKHSFQG